MEEIEIIQVPDCPCCKGDMADNQSNEDRAKGVDSYICEKCGVVIDICIAKAYKNIRKWRYS
jgi:hypothetical protein